MKDDYNQFRTDSMYSEGGGGGGASVKNRMFDVSRVYGKKEKHTKFKSNEIQTSKYNVVTFLPKNLFFQFMKFSNIYFLMMAMLEVTFNLIK